GVGSTPQRSAETRSPPSLDIAGKTRSACLRLPGAPRARRRRRSARGSSHRRVGFRARPWGGALERPRLGTAGLATTAPPRPDDRAAGQQRAARKDLVDSAGREARPLRTTPTTNDEPRRSPFRRAVTRIHRSRPRAHAAAREPERAN